MGKNGSREKFRNLAASALRPLCHSMSVMSRVSGYISLGAAYGRLDMNVQFEISSAIFKPIWTFVSCLDRVSLEHTQRCTKPQKSQNKPRISGISGLSGLLAQKSGTVPKVRNTVVSAMKKSGMNRNRSKLTQKHVFRFNLCEFRLFAVFCLSRSRSVEWAIYLLKGMAAGFWITQVTQVTTYVYLLK